jgi:hypothetical protein
MGMRLLVEEAFAWVGEDDGEGVSVGCGREMIRITCLPIKLL